MSVYPQVNWDDKRNRLILVAVIILIIICVVSIIINTGNNIINDDDSQLSCKLSRIEPTYEKGQSVGIITSSDFKIIARLAGHIKLIQQSLQAPLLDGAYMPFKDLNLSQVTQGHEENSDAIATVGEDGDEVEGEESTKTTKTTTATSSKSTTTPSACAGDKIIQFSNQCVQLTFYLQPAQQDRIRIEMIQVNLRLANGSNRICRIEAPSIEFDMWTHYTCYDTRIYRCKSTRVSTNNFKKYGKTIALLVLGTFEFDMNGDEKSIRAGNFITEHYFC